MAFSLGELFVSLGFDVDDQKLKDFRQNIKDAHDDIVRMGEAATATIGVLTIFSEKAALNAQHLTQLRVQYGANTQAVQTYANAVHGLNSAIGVPTAQDSFAKFSKMISSDIPNGSGDAAALAILTGGAFKPGTGQSGVDMFNAIAKNIDNSEKMFPGGRQRIGDFFERVGLGREGLQAAELLGHDPAKYNEYSKYNTSDDRLENLSKFAQTMAKLEESLTHFSMIIADDIVGPLGKAVEGVIKIIDNVSGFNEKHPGIATAEGVAGSAATVYGGWKLLKSIGGFLGGRGAAAASGAAVEAEAGGSILSNPIGWIVGASLASTYGASYAGKQIAGMWNNSHAGGAAAGGGGLIMGKWTPLQWAGIMRRLQMESGLDPHAYGKGVGERKGEWHEAYGIAQWDPKRQADFKRIMGRDIHGSSLNEQLAFMNYELTQGTEQKAGRALSGAQTATEAYKIFTKMYERPAGAQNITVNINAPGGDAHEIKTVVRRELQAIINKTNMQTNLGPVQ